MADYISQLTLPNNTTYNLRDPQLKVYSGTCTTAAGTAIKEVTTSDAFILEKGAVIFVTFSNTNTAAVGDLKLRVNNTTDANLAKFIKYEHNAAESNLPGKGYIRANQTYQFYYDGTYWVMNTDYHTYTNDFASRVGHYNNILARKAITAESLIVGDSTGYEKVASGVTFDLAYPIVWCTAAVAINTSNYANMFLQHYDRNIATGAKSGFTSSANKVIYLIVTISGNIATIDADIITDTLPSEENGKVYISLGKLGAQSTGANYFFLYPEHPMFWYKNGEIEPYMGAIVNQQGISTDANYPILFKNNANTTNENAGINFSNNVTSSATTTKPFTYNPNTGNLTVSQLKIAIKSDSYGLFPNANNYNIIGDTNRMWYKAYITNYYGTTSNINNWASGKNIGIPANSSAASTLGTVNFINTCAKGGTQTTTLLTADSTTNTNITLTMPNTTGTLALVSDIPTTMAWSSITNTPTTLSGYGITDAASSNHGNHVPETQTANNITFLRNDNTWFKLTKTEVNTLINLLDTGSSDLTANDYVITQYVGGGTTTTSYHRRPASKVVNSTLVKAALGTVATTAKKFLKDTGSWIQVDWGDLTGKPDSFTPASHTHSHLVSLAAINSGDSNNNNFKSAIKKYFDDNKSTVPRNSLVNFYSSAYNNGSKVFGYYLSGHDSNPYGGFFIAHYDTPRYVGILNGTYTESKLARIDIGNTITSGQIMISDGTDGKIKSSGYTIATSVPANALFTDTNKYHKTGSWGGTNNLTYTATAVNNADALAFTLPTASASAYGVTKLSAATNDAGLAATAKSVYDLGITVSGLLAAADAMIFKGTLGTGGTITAVPDGTSGKEYQAGYTYKIITAGTYADIVCEVGDLLIAISDSASGQTAVNNTHWTVAQTNIDGAVTGPASASATGNIAIFDGTTGKIIKDSGTTIANATVAKAGAANLTTTTNALAYYTNTTGTFGNASKITVYNNVDITVQNATKKRNGIRLSGTCYGNTAADLTSNTVGVMRYEDGGVRIEFSADSSDNAALLYTNHDSANTGGGASFHFVGQNGSNNTGGNLAVTAPDLVARRRMAIGSNFTNSSYALHVTGDSLFKGNVNIQGNVIWLQNANANQSAAGSYPYITSLRLGDAQYVSLDEYKDDVLSVHGKGGLLLYPNATIAVYDNTKTYAVNNIVWYDRQYYYCKTAIETAEEWTSSHWTAFPVAAGNVWVWGGINPIRNNAYNLGTSSYKWSNVYATTFTGSLTGDVTGNAETITANTSNGNYPRPIWFSYHDGTNVVNGKLGYNTNFTYNPSTNSVIFTENGIIASNSGKTTTIDSGSTLYLNKPTNSSILFTSGGTANEKGRFNINGNLQLDNSNSAGTQNTHKLYVKGDSAFEGKIAFATAASNAIANKAYMQWNATDLSIDFIFE